MPYICAVIIKYNGDKYSLFTTAYDIPLSRYIEYFKHSNTAQKILEDINAITGDLSAHLPEDAKTVLLDSQSELLVGYFKEIACCLHSCSTLPMSVIEKMDMQQMVDILNRVDYSYKPKPRNKFVFTSISQSEEIEYKNQIDEAKNYFKKLKIKNKLKMLKNTEYFIKKDFGTNTYKQFIIGMNIVKKLTKAGKDIEDGNLEFMNEIIATLALPKGEDFTDKGFKNRQELFKDLPMATCLDIGAFFLKTRLLLLIDSAVYLKKTELMKGFRPKSQLNII